MYGPFLVLGSFLLYLLTLAPSVTFWDSGELIAASSQLGISHQPGYPLFAVMGRLFSLIPLGAVAYRINLLSAFFSALSVYLLYRVILEIYASPIAPLPGETEADSGALASSGKGDNIPAAVAASFAVVLAAVRVFWSQAVVTEVYALNSFFILILVFLYVSASKGRLSPQQYFPLSGFTFGLGVVNHQSLILYLPALALGWLLLPGLNARGRLRSPRRRPH